MKTILGSVLAMALAAEICPASGSNLPEPDQARLREDLEFLCSDALDGRETGTPGAARAAAYLAGKMQEAGLTPLQAGGWGGATPFHFPWAYGEARWFFAPAPAGRWPAPGRGREAWDVVGVVPGTDPALDSEYVFVTAHFDHLGSFRGAVYRGADDDASGTAALLEAMRLLRHAQPRRTLAFLGVSGEEEGLLGSEAFLARPPIALEAIKADINLDMVGRGRPGELHVMPARRQGSVTTLTRDARACARAHGVALSAGMEAHWQDSDHYSFARRGVASVCFNTGLHEDYHQPTDTPDKIDYQALANVVRIVRDLALATADADQAPAVLPPKVWRAWAWGPYRTPGSEPGPAGLKKNQDPGQLPVPVEVGL
jgi:hypothetical protein